MNTKLREYKNYQLIHEQIARGLSPFQPEKVAFEAGRIMLNRIKELLNSNESFAFETTLSTRSYMHTIQQAKARGYTTTLLFHWLQSIELAKERGKGQNQSCRRRAQH